LHKLHKEVAGGGRGLTMARKPSEEFYEELKKKNKILRERLAMQSKSLIELIRSGKLRPPQEINACQFCLGHYKNEQEG
jgi:transposase-like protein